MYIYGIYVYIYIYIYGIYIYVYIPYGIYDMMCGVYDVQDDVRYMTYGI